MNREQIQHQTERNGEKESGLTRDEIKSLIGQALLARQRSYAPYSGYMVGAALLCEDGEVICGCNIENAAYTPTNCAERTAVFKAVSEGRRHFRAIAVTGGLRGSLQLDLSHPCGVCRQVLAEFCTPDRFWVITARSEEDYELCLLDDLLPHSFGPHNLQP